MLEDFRKVMVDRRGEEEQFSSEHIAECMKKGNVGPSFPLQYRHVGLSYSRHVTGKRSMYSNCSTASYMDQDSLPWTVHWRRSG
jgi:hypothetical protein